jgi:Ca2+-binding RTX toxin-like protein
MIGRSGNFSDGSHDSGDTLAGGSGHDNFVFAAHFGENTISYFHSHKDTIELSNSEFVDLSAVLATAREDSGNTIISHGHDVITLESFNLAQTAACLRGKHVRRKRKRS